MYAFFAKVQVAESLDSKDKHSCFLLMALVIEYGAIELDRLSKGRTTLVVIFNHGPGI